MPPSRRSRPPLARAATRGTMGRILVRQLGEVDESLAKPVRE